MKKIALGLALTTLILTGCSGMSTKNQDVQNISWRYVNDLPAPKGYEKQHGVAGPLAGNIGEYVVVAGGANFPHKSVLEGGPKVVYPDLYLMKQTKDGLKMISHTHLPNEIGYGTTISTGNEIYYVGGTYQTGVSNKILKITLNKNKTDVIVSTVGTLPFDYHSGVAAFHENNIYIVTGKQNGQNSKNFYKFDLATGNTTALKMFPGTERSQSVGQVLNNGAEDMLYVFGGGTGVAFTDGYTYSFKQDKWFKVKDVELDGKEISVLGANSVTLNDNQMLVIGGFNKAVWDDANLKLGSLKGEALQNYRQDYFTKAPEGYNWNKEMLVYNAMDNTWKSLGQIPFMAPCGEGLVRVDDVVYSINGEIKPGVRSEKIYEGTIK